MTSINAYLSHLLLRMIELYERSCRPNGYDVWHNGRLLELWAGGEVTKGLRGCFTRYDAGDVAGALRASAELYSALARAAAMALGYPYPEGAEQSATQIFNELLENK